MTLNDFKMWLSGYAENIGEAPTPAQWQRIQEALKSVGDVPKPPVSLPSVWIDPMKGVGGGTGNPPHKWADVICQNKDAAEADRQRRISNNQTVEVR